MDIKIQFFCPPSTQPKQYERFYKPKPEECEIINRFFDYNPVIDSINLCPSLNHLRGFYWCFGASELLECSDHKCEPAFLVIYFQNEISDSEFEGYKKVFSDMLDLDCRGTKLKPEVPCKTAQLPYGYPTYLESDKTTFIDGKEFNVTTIAEQTDEENEKRIKELIAILQNDKNLIEVDNTVP